MTVRDLYLRGLKGRQLIERELAGRDTYDRPLRRRLWLWRHGFLSESDYVYDLDDGNHRQYLTDVERFVRTPRINGEWNVALSNKLVFHWLLSQFERHRVPVYGMVRDGTFLPLDDIEQSRTEAVAGIADGGETELRNTNADAGAEVRALLEAEGKLVLKWIKGGGGENVFLCSRTDDGYVVNGVHKTDSEFDSLVNDLHEYLITAFVEQSAFSSSVYPDTTNTIRLLTMYDDTEGEAFIPIVILRAGTDRSAPMDNFGQGGISVEIDRETGALGEAVQLRNETELSRHATHPSTNRQLDGVTLPGWPTIRDRMLEIAEANRQLPYVGWDLVPTDDRGAFKILEGNSYPGMKSLQCHRPLLAEDRVRAFYRRHGVLQR